MALLISLALSFAVAAEPTTIPLKEIWAFEMPGTKDVTKLDIDEDDTELPFYQLSSRKLDFHINDEQNKKAGPAFAVLGRGREAFIAAHRRIPMGETPRNSFPVGHDVSVVFFAGGYNAFVHLHKVERLGNVMKIHYRFVMNINPNRSAHFALIPMGKLPVGEYEVEIIESPDPEFKKKYGVEIEETWAVDPKRVREAVCSSFSFNILEREENQPSWVPSHNKGAKQ